MLAGRCAWALAEDFEAVAFWAVFLGMLLFAGLEACADFRDLDLRDLDLRDLDARVDFDADRSSDFLEAFAAAAFNFFESCLLLESCFDLRDFFDTAPCVETHAPVRRVAWEA